MARGRRGEKFIFPFGLGFIVLILGLLAFGYYDTRIAPRWQAVARVNETVFTASQLVAELKLARALGADLENLKLMLEPIVQDMQNRVLIRRGARERGLIVTPKEIEERIRRLLTRSGEKQVPPEELEKRYKEHIKGLGLSDAEFRKRIEDDILREKLGQYLAERVPESAEQVHLYGILVADREKAEEVKQRLEGGEDFAVLAKELSLDEGSKDRGGEMGWYPRGLRPFIDEVAFSLEIGKVSEPIPTPEGYWVIKVVEKKERAIDEAKLQLLKANALWRWLDEERKNNRVESYLSNPKVIRWVLSQVS